MSAFAYLPAGARAPRVVDAKTGRCIGLHVAALDTASHLGVLFKPHTGRSQPERPLQLARVARDRHTVASPWDGRARGHRNARPLPNATPCPNAGVAA